ncbi:MAG: type II secretion system protein [Nanoarchaeota archaeon]|nr:type II secretion system protein [Nanoarchaeota archaeon]
MTTHTKEKGFTVVELLVAMSVFTALLSFAVGVFVQGMRSQRELTDQIVVNNEMSLVLEQMAREMRTGSFFAPEGGRYETLSFTSENLRFEEESGRPVTYKLSASAGARGVPEKYISRNDGSGDIPFTGKDVSVDELKFFVSRGEFCAPWRVTILMKVRPRFSARDPMPIQTTVSSRVLPVDLKRDDDRDGLDDFASCKEYLVTES